MTSILLGTRRPCFWSCAPPFWRTFCQTLYSTARQEEEDPKGLSRLSNCSFYPYYILSKMCCHWHLKKIFYTEYEVHSKYNFRPWDRQTDIRKTFISILSVYNINTPLDRVSQPANRPSVPNYKKQIEWLTAFCPVTHSSYIHQGEKRELGRERETAC